MKREKPHDGYGGAVDAGRGTSGIIAVTKSVSVRRGERIMLCSQMSAGFSAGSHLKGGQDDVDK